MSWLLRDVLSSSDLEKLLGPSGLVALRTLPSTYWWVAGMSVALAVMALTVRGRKDKAAKEEGEKKAARIQTDEDALREGLIDPAELKPVVDDGEEEENDLHTIGRVKSARHKVIRQKIEEQLTPEERVKEQMIQSQQLAKIYSLLRENQDQLGEMSFDDVKQQLGMYKTE